jgi:hypothetical protein
MPGNLFLPVITEKIMLNQEPIKPGRVAGTCKKAVVLTLMLKLASILTRLN